jgi:hypothetical protein
MSHTGGLPRRDQYGRSVGGLWSRSPFLDCGTKRGKVHDHLSIADDTAYGGLLCFSHLEDVSVRENVVYESHAEHAGAHVCLATRRSRQAA